jgi:hypothetical protein
MAPPSSRLGRTKALALAALRITVNSNRRALFVFLITTGLAIVPLLLGGCETQTMTLGMKPWSQIGTSPFMWRSNVATGNVAEIRNDSSSKLHVVGVCSQDNFPSGPAYVDGSQPGAFDITLYPSEERDIVVAGDLSATHTHIQLGSWEVVP